MWSIYNIQKRINHYIVILILPIMMNTRIYTAKLIQTDSLKASNVVDKIKYILLWQADEPLKSIVGEGQDVFLQNDCPVDNCYITADRNFFGGDLRKFHTILFNGSNKNWYLKGDLPKKRYYHQKYAFIQRESTARTYVCHTGFDNFFNWTITYKLDSDIVFPHIHIRNETGHIIGLTKEEIWITDTLKTNHIVPTNLKNKTKAAAWLYSNCEPSIVNRKFVERLEKSLNKYGLKIDVYGKCGPLNCSTYDCDEKLKTEYYFYLALEDSFAEDYVTGNVLRALRNNVVPIVYGGADYSRFLPPKSYLDGTLQSTDELAALINILVENQAMYSQYFWWKSHYSFCLGQASLPLKGLSYCGQTMCDLCQALHDVNKYRVRSVYKDFRKWWFPGYVNKCRTKHPSPQKVYKRENKKTRVKKVQKKGSLKKKKENDDLLKQNKEPSIRTQKEKEKEKNGTITEEMMEDMKKRAKQKKKKMKNRRHKLKRKLKLRKTRRKGHKRKKGKSNRVAARIKTNSTKEVDLKSQPYSVQRNVFVFRWIGKAVLWLYRTVVSVLPEFFGLVVEGMGDTRRSSDDDDEGPGSRGGGGGGVARTMGAMAIELSRVRFAALDNSFDLNKR